MTITRKDKIEIHTNFDDDGYKIPFEVSDENGNIIIDYESCKDFSKMARELKCSFELASFLFDLLGHINWNINVLNKDTKELATKLLEKENITCHYVK